MKTEILAVLCGQVRPFRGDDEPSAIGKLPVAHAVAVGSMGLAGDEQADRTVHGGIDKAIHHYPADHYGWWRQHLGDTPLLDAPGAFGENISTTGLDETTSASATASASAPRLSRSARRASRAGNSTIVSGPRA